MNYVFAFLEALENICPNFYKLDEVFSGQPNVDPPFLASSHGGSRSLSDGGSRSLSDGGSQSASCGRSQSASHSRSQSTSHGGSQSASCGGSQSVSMCSSLGLWLEEGDEVIDKEKDVEDKEMDD